MNFFHKFHYNQDSLDLELKLCLQTLAELLLFRKGQRQAFTLECEWSGVLSMYLAAMDLADQAGPG